MGLNIQGVVKSQYLLKNNICDSTPVIVGPIIDPTVASINATATTAVSCYGGSDGVLTFPSLRIFILIIH